MRIEIDEAKAKQALSKISADICESKPIEEYKKLFSSFVDRVDVFEDYVTIVLKVFDVINVYLPRRSRVEMERPPLEMNQMVVTNGGGEGNRTPVRNPIRKSIYILSLKFNIPLRRRQKTGCGI